ncbi:MAG: hydantoinase/oxoprolinase family protein [Burkholderiales bacterium]|nr:hydantoinase/oxoprolinase family protein [Burkholderiales bacterium]
MSRNLKVAADIGGTFTDITLMLEDGSIATEKVPSTPDDYSRGIADGMRALLASLGIPAADVGEVLHGCTVATNAILEGRGARTGLVTTRGFRDVLELRRIRVPRLYDPLYVKPDPLAPRELRLEVTERIGADGRVVVPLAEGDVAAAIDELRRQEVEAIAVCCLHSYANPIHERRIGQMIRAALPDVFLTLSCDVLPEIREYERTSTTVINAYVGPPVASYIGALDASLRRLGVAGRLLVMQSTGGILDAQSVMRMPARIVECGPAAGVIGGAFQAAASGYRDVITFDMGGTTAKAAMIEDGRIVRTDEYEVGGGISLSSRLVKGGGYALKLPVIDISEVGAGGGSLVWFDRAGALKVGPRSAGAAPGPACYGAGNAQATVTDANVVLGYLNPRSLAGGAVAIRHDLARAALERTAAAGAAGSALDAAWAVYVVAAANMMRAVKAVSTYRGRDPRDCVLMAFGGNGGVFAVELARQLQMRRVLVPPAAGVFSALGLSVAPIEFTQTHACLVPLASAIPDAIAATLAMLEDSVASVLGLPRGRLAMRHAAAMRYIGQAFELVIPMRAGAVSGAELARLAEAFALEHERTYGHRFDDGDGVELVALEVTGTYEDARHGPQRLSTRPRALAAGPASRAAYFGPGCGMRETAVIERTALGSAPRHGPFIVEEYEGTTVVPPDASVFVDAGGNIVIDVDLEA